MNIYHYLQEMQQDLWTEDWTQMDRKYHSLCTRMATENEAKRIQTIDLNAYQDELKKGLVHSLEIADQYSGKAVYFEYDLDNDWNGHLFVCRNYHPMKVQDDDWACDWSYQIEGPTLTAFAAIYAESGFDRTEKAIGITLYLVAKTVIAFSRHCRKINSTIPLCIGFHDQDPIMRTSREEL
ncbi:hypothetical protein [Desmospora profundinema]|uniref:Uncharacterized protein n=1 Tax=Desmospora profundinema TaxID=1571184 RepID=A0ABU1ISS1_9BACL|nr:hypothetical protein [Desmospora profundinema]MDR6227244.1 hypothetical protein [Desmospora profundinema]